MQSWYFSMNVLRVHMVIKQGGVDERMHCQDFYMMEFDFFVTCEFYVLLILQTRFLRLWLIEISADFSKVLDAADT